MAAKDQKLSEMQLINRWVWFFALYFLFIILIAMFGLVAEF
ncbi:MAG: hypothetical protein SGJ27_19465 [Candidatus Melainabacteria bacterium]|nr:hypothetical protein [Candidatus Melainabacteria bacterium]